MESPFIDFSGSAENLVHKELNGSSTILHLSPFSDEVFHTTAVESVITEFQVPAGNRVLIGSASFEKADPVVAASPEYREPVVSGNVLVSIQTSERNQNLSAHFKSGELARAQAGKVLFRYFRTDPVLIDNLERLRNFLGKPVVIIDGYYTPRYLKEVLRVIDPGRIAANPHITGRGVKLSVEGFDRMVKQLAIAAIVVCDKDINLGIGSSTMTLAVKQPLLNVSDPPPEDVQRIRSYIADEKVKVNEVNFCLDFKRLHSDHRDVFVEPLFRAMGAFTATMLKFHFNATLPAELTDWQTPLAEAISLMHQKSMTKHPNVILYVLAYSSFGHLYRYYLNNRNNGSTENLVIEALATDIEKSNRNHPGSLFYLQQKADKSPFINTCSERMRLSYRRSGSSFCPVPLTFFNWTKNPEEKNFLDSFSGLIKKVYIKNGYTYIEVPQQLPAGGTKHDLKLSPPAPDNPVADYTGRYYASFSGNDPVMLGFYVLINQTGNYIAGKWGQIRDKTPVSDLRKTVTFFFGTVAKDGVATCTVYPQQTIRLRKVQGNTILEYTNHKTGDQNSGTLILQSVQPVLSTAMLDALQRNNPEYREVMITLAWIHPPSDRFRAFVESFRVSEPAIRKSITGYYNTDETIPNVRSNLLSKWINELDFANNNYLKLPLMFSRFSNYYARFIYSVGKHWSPRSDRETRSTLNWIRRMLEDYRDLRGTGYIEQNHKRLFEFFGVDTKIPDVQYVYSISISLSAFGFGPFARSSGTISISNKTDYSKYPSAEKWSEASYPVVLWNATLSLNPLKMAPKISAGQKIEAELTTGIFYSANDFSGAGIQVTEGKIFEVPFEVDAGSVKIGTKIGVGGVVILIDGNGKKTLEFEAYQGLDLPDTIEIEPSDGEKEGTYEKIAKFLPSLTMYKGSIDTKDTSSDIKGVPLPDHFKASYQIQDTRYFMHDNATLTPQAIEAIGRLCAEEKLAFTDPSSEIEIYGHADASGDFKYNMELSLARAMNVKQAILDRFNGKKMAGFKKVEGLGEKEANDKYGEYTQKNAWLRRVVILINGRAVLSMGEL